MKIGCYGELKQSREEEEDESAGVQWVFIPRTTHSNTGPFQTCQPGEPYRGNIFFFADKSLAVPL